MSSRSILYSAPSDSDASSSSSGAGAAAAAAAAAASAAARRSARRTSAASCARRFLSSSSAVGARAIRAMALSTSSSLAAIAAKSGAEARRGRDVAMLSSRLVSSRGSGNTACAIVSQVKSSQASQTGQASRHNVRRDHGPFLDDLRVVLSPKLCMQTFGRQPITRQSTRPFFQAGLWPHGPQENAADEAASAGLDTE